MSRTGFTITELTEGPDGWYCRVDWEQGVAPITAHWEGTHPSTRHLRTGPKGRGLFILGSDGGWHEVVPVKDFCGTSRYHPVRGRIERYVARRGGPKGRSPWKGQLYKHVAES